MHCAAAERKINWIKYFLNIKLTTWMMARVSKLYLCVGCDEMASFYANKDILTILCLNGVFIFLYTIFTK